MMTTSNKPMTRGDFMEFDKQFPLVLDKPLCKKPKYMDEVWVSFGRGHMRKGWVLALTGGDFSATLTQETYGDMISFFFPPIRGEQLYRGIQHRWLMDIGIGKTEQECLDSYRKHDWFKRPKSYIQTHRFWAYVSKNKQL